MRVSIRAMTRQFSMAEVVQAVRRIRPYISKPTPVMTSESINRMVGCNVHFKCENMQKTGSFKARGAINAVAHLLEQQPEVTKTGVVTHSSGNHGAALAYAAQQLNVPCTVVAPDNAPQSKLRAIEAYGAQLVMCPATLKDRQATCERVMNESGAELIHPHDNYDVMAGQGTMAEEFLSECPDLDVILVPTGGGGMASGIATVAHSLRPECKVFCVEPFGKNMAESFAAGRRLWAEPPPTLDSVADGMRVGNIGLRCFPVLMDCAQTHVFTVNDQEILAATKLIWERMKLVVETSSGTGLAAALQSGFPSHIRHAQNIGIILCGGNVDLDNLPW